MDLLAIVSTRWSKRRTVNKVLAKLAKVNVKNANQLRQALLPPNADKCALNRLLLASGARPFGQSTVEALLRVLADTSPPSPLPVSFVSPTTALQNKKLAARRPRTMLSAIQSFDQKLRPTITTVTRRDGTRFVENKHGTAHEISPTETCRECKQWRPLCKVVSNIFADAITYSSLIACDSCCIYMC